MLNHRADLKVVLFLLAMVVLTWTAWLPTNIPVILFPVYLIMPVSAFSIAHNHQHRPIWKSKLMNGVTDYLLTVLSYYPVCLWRINHNENHHLYENNAQDLSCTFSHTRKNNLLTLWLVPLLVFFKQGIATFFCFKKKGITKKAVYDLSQILVLIFYFSFVHFYPLLQTRFLILIQCVFSIFFLLILSYLQHVETDENSKFNNCRNFTGKFFNAVMFNAGFHTAHHRAPMLHWSELPQEQSKIVSQIDSKLIQPSFLKYLFKTYVKTYALGCGLTKS